MRNDTKHTIPISVKHAAAVRKAVESGAYASTNAVVRDALDLWQQTQIIDDEHLRQLWKEGIESGTAGLWNKDKFLDWARKRRSASAPALQTGANVARRSLYASER